MLATRVTPGIVKAWAIIEHGVLKKSFNVSGVAPLGSGQFTLAFENPFGPDRAVAQSVSGNATHIVVYGS